MREEIFNLMCRGGRLYGRLPVVSVLLLVFCTRLLVVCGGLWSFVGGLWPLTVSLWSFVVVCGGLWSLHVLVTAIQASSYKIFHSNKHSFKCMPIIILP